MTEQKRKTLSYTILTDEESSSNNKYFEEESLNKIRDKVKEDENNRAEFISINDRLYSLEKEYNLLTSSKPFSLEISEVVYKSNISSMDNIELWKGASLTTDNIFYDPLNRETINLNPINDGVGKCNIEPKIPDKYKAFTIDNTTITIKENIVILFIKWLINGYLNGVSTYGDFLISSGYENNKSLNIDDLPSSIVDTDKRTRVLINGTNHFFAYILNATSSSVTFFEVVNNTTPITYPLNVVGNLTANDAIIISYIEEMVAIYFSLIKEEKDLLSTRKNKNQKDVFALSNINILYNTLNSFISLETKTNSDFFNLLSTLNDRETYISIRKSEIEAFFQKEYIKEDEEGLYDQRSFIIKLRLKKKDGTLNNVYREITSSNVAGLNNISKQENIEYYRKKMIVFRSLQDATGAKFLFFKDFSPLATNIKIGDIVYIIDDENEELATTITNIADDYMEQMNSFTALQTKVGVKKIFFDNRIPEKFKKDNNLRIVKQLKS